MATTVKKHTNGMGPVGLLMVVLTAVFAIAKITGYTQFSWLVVFSPLLIYVGTVTLILTVLLTIVVLGHIMK
jgi:hypothetical protein